MASVSEYRPKFVQVSNIHARVTVKWPFGVPPTCLIPKRSAQVGSPSNRHKNATRLFFFLFDRRHIQVGCLAVAQPDFKSKHGDMTAN